MLLKHGADVGIRNSQGKTAFDLITSDHDCQIALQESLEIKSRPQVIQTDLKDKVKGMHKKNNVYSK